MAVLLICEASCNAQKVLPDQGLPLQICATIRTLSSSSPCENGYAETIHSELRDEFLAREVFESLAAARKLTAAWRKDYNHHRPHSSLGYRTPVEFAARCAASVAVTPSLQQHSGDSLTPTFIAAGTGI
jgi:transposase InsO family protein